MEGRVIFKTIFSSTLQTSIYKLIPFIGLFIGLVLGLKRLVKDGSFLNMIFEIISGSTIFAITGIFSFAIILFIDISLMNIDLTR